MSSHSARSRAATTRGFTRILVAILLVIILLAGTWVRVSIAPHTAGPDIPQFAGFADSFLRHGLCFFHHTGTNSSRQERWPYPWPYPYGVLPAILLGLARVIAPQNYEVRMEGSIYRVYTPVEWIVAVKTIYIVSDILSAIVIFLITSSWSRRLAVVATALFYLNPLTIYISSIFGQLDPVATALYLAGLLFYYRFAERNSNSLIAVGALIGLSATSKPNMIVPAGAFMIYSIVKYALSRDGSRILRLLSGAAIGAVVPFLIFEFSCPGGLLTLYSAMSDVGKTGYYHGIIYSLNGLTSLASYMHFKTGKDFLWVIERWWVPAIALTSVLLIGLYAEIRGKGRSLSLVQVAYLLYLIYLSTYWKVHYQYFVGLLALYSLLVADRTVDLLNKILASIHSICVVLYVFMFPTSFWAWYYLRNPNKEVTELLDKLSMRVYDEEIYLLYSLVLTFIGYLVVIGYTLITVRASHLNKKQTITGSEEAVVNEHAARPKPSIKSILSRFKKQDHSSN